MIVSWKEDRKDGKMERKRQGKRKMQAEKDLLLFLPTCVPFFLLFRN